MLNLVLASALKLGCLPSTRMFPVMRPIRRQYEDFMQHVYTQGVPKTDRTGTGTKSVFGYQMRFDLNEGRHPSLRAEASTRLST